MMPETSAQAQSRCGRWVVALEGDGVDGDVVGGKAAAIDRLVAAGFPVPESAAVTVDAYRNFIEQEPVRQLLERVDLDDDGDSEAATERLEKAFVDAPIPSEIEAAVRSAAEAIAGRTGSSRSVAARSSATVEDAGSASYAGQFATELGCEPGDAVLDAVRRVWASAWSPVVRAYRGAMGDDTAMHMGVLLMDMVDARHAGVVFTRSPEDEEQLRIEIVEGLGDKLVSGQVTPERKLVSRSDPTHDLNEADPPYLKELVETALDVEEQLGGEPQDIEWAHDGERLWILQSRPVTVGSPDASPTDGERLPDDGFDSQADGHVHTPNGVNEMLPGVVPPLVWTMTAPLLEEAFRSLFAGLGALPSHDLRRGHRFVGRFRGRAALDLDLLRASARLMPGQSEGELERQYFGEVVSPDLRDEPDDVEGGGLRALLPVWRAVRLRGAQRREAAIVNVATDQVLEARPDLTTMSDDELDRYHGRLLDLAARAITAEVAVAASAAAAYRTLERYLARLVEHDASELAQRLTAGGVPTCKATALDVCNLLEAACEDPDLSRALARGEDDVLDRVRRVEGGDAFLQQFWEILEREGSAQIFAGERWCDRPEAAMSTVRQALRRLRRDELDPEARLRELEHRLTSTWQWRASRVYTGQVVDVRIRLLRRTVADAIEFLRLREETKRTVLRIGGEIRRVIEHVADELVRAGRLPDRTDIELLGHDEFLDVLGGRELSDTDELDRRRTARRHMEQLGSLPPRFEDAPGRASSPEATTGHLLEGWGAGPGRHTGRPVVVTDLRAADLDEGDVLVATSTDPSWTPLFVTAGAVVVEQGGPLSHAAIVAREFGLPAVLNVPGSTDRLRDVEQVTVDGTAGTVEILGGSS